MSIPHITIADCRQIVGERHFITKEMMLSPKRQASLARPRQMAMTLAREFTDASTSLIARSFGRDHTTAMHAFAMVHARVGKYQECAAEFNYFRERLVTLSRERIDAGAVGPIQLIQPAGGIDLHRNTFSVAAE